MSKLYFDGQALFLFSPRTQQEVVSLPYAARLEARVRTLSLQFAMRTCTLVGEPLTALALAIGVGLTTAAFGASLVKRPIVRVGRTLVLFGLSSAATFVGAQVGSLHAFEELQLRNGDIDRRPHQEVTKIEDVVWPQR